MSKKMPVYVVAAANDLHNVSSYRNNCVYLVYTIHENGGLMRSELPAYARGGLMGLSDYHAPDLSVIDPAKLAGEIAAECGRRTYAGVLLDFEDPRCFPIVSELSSALFARRVPHYVPLALAAAAPQAKVLISSAISGGSYEEMLRGYCQRFDPSRLALDLVRVCSQYTMPSYDPDGRALSAAEFRELLDTHSPHCFFSHELCAKYFTCRTEDNSAHFILFDDISTVSQKIEIAESLGFCAAFLLYRDFGGGCRQLFAANG
ncbi:hypothetical protein [Acidaminobacterium chupaoyuni]